MLLEMEKKGFEQGTFFTANSQRDRTKSQWLFLLWCKWSRWIHTL